MKPLKQNGEIWAFYNGKKVRQSNQKIIGIILAADNAMAVGAHVAPTNIINQRESYSVCIHNGCSALISGGEIMMIGPKCIEAALTAYGNNKWVTWWR